MNTSSKRINKPSTVLLALLVGFILAGLVCGAWAEGGGGNGNSGGGGGTADGAGAPAGGAGADSLNDKNSIDPRKIRENYFKRFPFAKEAAKQDNVNNRESTAGGNTTYSNAEGNVTVKCNYFTGSMGNVDIHYRTTTQQGSVSTATKRDGEITKNLINTYGYPVSDTQFQVIDRENRQRFLEHMFDPERWVWSELATSQLMDSCMANSVGGAAQTSFKGAFDSINSVLINVANENAASPGGGSQGGGRTIPQAVYFVLQFYHQVFVPTALLLLLPGAVLTQVKGMVSFAFLGKDEDGVSPIDGILRSIVAIFLIPATQLIVSYCIDIGNVLAETVRDPAKQWVQEQTLMNWAREQMFVAPPGKANNAIVTSGHGGSSGGGSTAGGARQAAGGGNQAGNQGGNQSGGSGFNLNIFGGSQPGQAANQALNQLMNALFGMQGNDVVEAVEAVEDVIFGGGKAAGQASDSTVQEDQLFLSTTMQLVFNSATYLFGYALNVLTAYQLVFMCYLLLLGPIAAAFFAWPAGVGSLFRKVFGNWLNAVIVLSLWRFYWCVILACMTQRIVYLQQTGSFNPHAPEEMMVFSCFLALMLYVPFQPFSFNPGEAAASILDKVGQGGGGAGGGGAPGTDAAGAGHGGSAGQTVTRRSGVASKEFPAVASGAGKHLHTAAQDSSAGPGWSGGGSEPIAGAPPAGPSGTAGGGPHGAVSSAPPLSALTQVSGSGAHQSSAPPVSGGTGAGPAAASHLGEFANVPVQTMQPGQPPVVPLMPAGGAGGGQMFLAAANDAGQVNAALQSWQQVLAQSSGGAGANSAAASGPASEPGQGGAGAPSGAGGGASPMATGTPAGGVAQSSAAGAAGQPPVVNAPGSGQVGSSGPATDGKREGVSGARKRFASEQPAPPVPGGGSAGATPPTVSQGPPAESMQPDDAPGAGPPPSSGKSPEAPP